MRLKALAVMVVALALGLLAAAGAAAAAPLSFNVRLDRSLPDQLAGIDGRVYVFVTTTDPADPVYGGEPRLRADNNWAFSEPFWGLDVTDAHPGDAVTVADTPTDTYPAGVYGYPLPTIAELPAGHYWVQAYMNVYHTYLRADGFDLKLPYPGGSGPSVVVS
jgi:hypothetical protein